MAILQTVWFVLHVNVIVSNVLMFLRVAYITPISIILLYAFCLFNEIKGLANGQKVDLKFLMSNYSFHILTTQIVFLLLRSYAGTWELAMGIASLCQVMSVLVQKYGNLNNTLSKIIVKVNFYLTNGYAALQLFVMLEIMSILSVGAGKPFIMRLIGMVFYCVWFLLYRYAYDNWHRQVWSRLSMSISSLATKAPGFLKGILMNLSQLYAPLGNLAIYIYLTPHNNINKNNNNNNNGH